jgi:hypothetical protein
MRKVELQAAGRRAASQLRLAMGPGAEFQLLRGQRELRADQLPEAPVGHDVALAEVGETEARGAAPLLTGQQRGQRTAFGVAQVEGKEDEFAAGRSFGPGGDLPAPPAGGNAGQGAGQRPCQRVIPLARRGSSTGLSASVL